ncbi:BON domain-containing protein [Streptomyces spiralis]
MRHGVLGRTLGLAPERVRVRVDDGAAALSGRIGSVADLPVIVRLCESVAGVVAVDPHLTCAYGGADLDIEPPRESPSSAETTVGREPT